MPMDTFLRLPEEKRSLILTEGLKEFSSHSYQEANTDVITKACLISKGSLYHYFGSKKQFYLHLVSHCLHIYRAFHMAPLQGNDFYGLLFSSLSQKLRFVKEHGLETAFLAMAAREGNGEVAQEKNKLVREAMEADELQFRKTMKDAFLRLPLKPFDNADLAFKGLVLYATAIREDMLRGYQGAPEALHEHEEQMKAEMKQKLDLMLYGILKEEAR